MYLTDLLEEGNKGRETIGLDIHQPLPLLFPNLVLILRLILYQVAACPWVVAYLHQIQDIYLKVRAEG